MIEGYPQTETWIGLTEPRELIGYTKAGVPVYLIGGGADRTVRVRLEALIGQYRAGLQQAGAQTAAFGSQLTRTASQNSAAFTAMGAAAVVGGGLILKGLMGAGEEAKQFEATLMKLQTQIGVSAEEMRNMGDAALSLRGTGRGPQELADAAFFIESAGLRGANAMEVLEASAKAAAIGIGDTATVADLATSAMNAYGADVLSASQATDVLIGAVKEGKVPAEELASSLGKVLPIASTMGVTFEEVGGAVAAMSRTGTDAAMATTALRSMLIGIQSPAQNAEEAMAEFGLSSEGLRATIKEEGLWAALMELKEAIGDNDVALAEIFPNIRASAGVMDLLGTNIEDNAQVMENMGDTLGNTEEGFKQWEETAEAASEKFSASMKALKIVMGGTVLPVISSLTEQGTAALEMFLELPEPLQKATVLMTGLAGATGVLGGAFLIALPRIQTTRAALASMRAEMALMPPAARAAARGIGMLGGAMVAGIAGAGIGMAIERNITAPLIEAAEQGDRTASSIVNAIPGLAQLASLGRVAGGESVADAFSGGAEGASDALDALIDQFDRTAAAGRPMNRSFELVADHLRDVRESGDVSAQSLSALDTVSTKLGVALQRGMDPEIVKRFIDAIAGGGLTGEEALERLDAKLMETGTEAQKAASKAENFTEAFATGEDQLEEYQKVVGEVVQANRDLMESLIGFDKIEPAGVTDPEQVKALNDQLSEARTRLGELHQKQAEGGDVAESTMMKTQRRVEDLSGQVAEASAGALDVFTESVQSNFSLMTQFFDDLEVLADRGQGMLAAQFARIGPSSAAALREAVERGKDATAGLGSDIAQTLLLAKRQKIDPVLDRYAPNFSEKFTEGGMAARRAMASALDQLQEDLDEGISPNQMMLRLELIEGALQQLDQQGQIHMGSVQREMFETALATEDPQRKLELLLQILGEVGLTDATANVNVDVDDRELRKLLNDLERVGAASSAAALRASASVPAPPPPSSPPPSSSGSSEPEPRLDARGRPFQHGGFVPSTGLIHAHASEFVVNPQATAQHRAWLEQINAGMMPQSIAASPMTGGASGTAGEVSVRGFGDLVRRVDRLGDRIERLNFVLEIDEQELGRATSRALDERQGAVA